jgi:hypothetical protein
MITSGLLDGSSLSSYDALSSFDLSAYKPTKDEALFYLRLS